MNNLSFENYLKKVGEKKYQPIYERKMLRRRLGTLSSLEREQQRKKIEEKFKAINRSANANAKAAIRNNRTASNEAHKAIINAIKAWAAYATNPVNGNPFNASKYKEFRKYYISELNRLALGHGDEWKSTGVRLSEFFRRQKAKAQNFRKSSAENLRRARQAAENAKRATARAASLKALGAKQLFNNPRARLTALKYRTAGNARTQRALVEGEIAKLRAKAANLRQESKSLIRLGNAQAAAAANAEAAAANAQANELAENTSVFADPGEFEIINEANIERQISALKANLNANGRSQLNILQNPNINSKSTQFQEARKYFANKGYTFISGRIPVKGGTRRNLFTRAVIKNMVGNSQPRPNRRGRVRRAFNRLRGQ